MVFDWWVRCRLVVWLSSMSIGMWGSWLFDFLSCSVIVIVMLFIDLICRLSSAMLGWWFLTVFFMFCFEW